MKRSTICEFKNTIIITSCANDLFKTDYVRVLYHLQKNELPTKRKHALFPIFRISSTLLEDPIIRCYFSSEKLPIHIELPYSCLLTCAKLFCESIMFTRILATFNSLHFFFGFATSGHLGVF